MFVITKLCIFSRYIRHREDINILFTAVGLAGLAFQPSKNWRGAEEEA